jgi:ABC-type Fe3+ transport system permease subunit
MGNTPDVEIKKKLSLLNIILLCLVVISLLFEVTESYLFFSNLQSEYVYELFSAILVYVFTPMVLILCAVGVKRFDGSMYGGFIFYSLLLGILMRWEIYLNSGILMFILFKGTLIISIVLAYYILKRAFPYRRFLVKLDTSRLEQDLSQ